MKVCKKSTNQPGKKIAKRFQGWKTFKKRIKQLRNIVCKKKTKEVGKMYARKVVRNNSKK